MSEDQPAPGPRMVGERRPPTDAEARALASAVRLRILRLCLHEALTNKEIAARLDRPPASVLHHVRTLVETGFLAPQAERRGTRGAREVPYRATGKRWRMDAGGGPGAAGDAALAAFLQELADAGQEQLESSRLGLQLGPDSLAEFRERLFGLLDEFAGRPADPAGRKWSVFVGMHPEP